MRLFAPLIPAKYKPINASQVANAMLQTSGQNLVGQHIFESDALQGY